MPQRTSELEDIILHKATRESHQHYGGQGPALNPLEQLIKAETDGGEERTAATAEILLRLLTFATDAISIDGMEGRWKRVVHVIKPGHSVNYQKEDPENGIYLPFVELKGPVGNAVKRWEPARLKSIYKPRIRDRFNTHGLQGKVRNQNSSAEIKVMELTPQSAAVRVGTRVISMAALAGVSRLRELSGAGLAKTLGVTRQAVSLTNRAVDERIRGVTGGKSGAYGLRHTVDPRKGKARVHAAAPDPQEGGFPALPMRAHRGQGRPALPLHR